MKLWEFQGGRWSQEQRKPAIIGILLVRLHSVARSNKARRAALEAYRARVVTTYLTIFGHYKNDKKKYRQTVAR